MKSVHFLCWAGLLILASTWVPRAGSETAPEPQGIYRFSAFTIDGAPKSLADYRGSIVLIVNTASECGLPPQYQALETLYRRFRERGLKILGFPANNFGGQEPGSESQIRAFCQKNYGVTFDLFAKISAKGEDIHPLYRYLTTGSGFDGEIRWNFTKFLVDRDGKVVARFEPRVDPLSPEIVTQVETLFNTPPAQKH